VVRTSFRHPALCKDWAQLNRRRKSEGALPAEVMRRVAPRNVNSRARNVQRPRAPISCRTRDKHKCPYTGV
jgi:hypothetical protein